MRTTEAQSEITFETRLREFDLTFTTTWGLFSPKAVDAGTYLLIDYLEIDEGSICLDLGCGYGAIGITMAKCSPTANIYMVDKDFVAVEYARKNVIQNNLNNCQVLLSNGFSHLNDIQFDVIASNLPANVGKELLQTFFSHAKGILDTMGKSMLSLFQDYVSLSKETLWKYLGTIKR